MPALSILIKPASAACNLRCRYCFYRRPAQAFMSDAILALMVKNALRSAEGGCTFAFQGGEPTLVGLDFYARLLALQAQYNVHQLTIENTLQTNGVLLDDAWCAFLAKHNFLVGLSLDGPRKIHEANRCDAEGNGSFNAVMQAAGRLKRHGVAFNILSVITAQSARQPDALYAFYQKKGYSFVQLIPCLAQGTGEHNLQSGQYGDFLCRLFDLWYSDFVRGAGLDIRFFSNLVQMAAGYAPEACGMCGRCTPYPVVEADGRVYPCDFYVVDGWRLGTVAQDFRALLQSETAQRFAAVSRTVHADCAACPHAFLCRGGCRRWREPFVDGQAGRNVLCADYKQFFAHCAPRIELLAQQIFRA
ncbi:MAG: anaerobic sulfatase maturase [Oscillospiraceae bacterium]|nr:anaerobic sulfatase maturase [Oscillospiraceae bacterium]